jgi:hypothetical protein
MNPKVAGVRPGTPGAFLFLHERTSPGGNRRLVFIYYSPETYSFTARFIAGYNLSIRVTTPGTWTSRPLSGTRGRDLDVLSGFPRTMPRVRVFAGQVDPDDAAHFTIRYQMWDQEDILDGRLDDLDNVTLTPRKPPRPPA